MKLQPSIRGFSLIECMVYLSVFAAVSTLSVMAFLHCQRNSAALRRNADDVIRSLKAGERWRKDVRAATGAPRLATQDGCEELHLPGAGGEVVYFFKESAVWRKSRGTPVRVLRGVKSSQMLRDPGAQVMSWRWEIELQGIQKEIRVRPLFTFQTVQGGRS